MTERGLSGVLSLMLCLRMCFQTQAVGLVVAPVVLMAGTVFAASKEKEDTTLRTEEVLYFSSRGIFVRLADY